MAGGKEEYNAFFYSLVSTDTQVCFYVLRSPIFLNYDHMSSLPNNVNSIICTDLTAGDVLLNQEAAVSN